MNFNQAGPGDLSPFDKTGLLIHPLIQVINAGFP